jgi:hypothetical protein
MRGRGQLLHFTDPDVIGSVLGSHEKPRYGKKVDEENASVKSRQNQTEKKTARLCRLAVGSTRRFLSLNAFPTHPAKGRKAIVQPERIKSAEALHVHDSSRFGDRPQVGRQGAQNDSTTARRAFK